jgi:hypothetical protein
MHLFYSPLEELTASRVDQTVLPGGGNTRLRRWTWTQDPTVHVQTAMVRMANKDGFVAYIGPCYANADPKRYYTMYKPLPPLHGHKM